MPDLIAHPLELHLEVIDDLFVDPDTNPLANPNLRTSGIQTLLEQLRDLPSDAPVQLTLYLPADQITPGLDARLQDATRRYCEFQIGLLEREAKNTRTGGMRDIRYGLIGMGFFLILSVISYAAYGNLGNPVASALAGILATFFSVASWVVIWNPVDTMVYGWRPVLREARLYRRIADAPLAVKPE
jgi:hypothetical protein